MHSVRSGLTNVYGQQFLPGSSATMVVKAAPGGDTLYNGSLQIDEWGNFEAYLGDTVDLVPGMYVSVSGLDPWDQDVGFGPVSVTKEVTLVALSVDPVFVDDTVIGLAPSNAVVSVDALVDDSWRGFYVTSDANGNWAADFSTIGVDLISGMHVGAAVSEDDMDTTSADVDFIVPGTPSDMLAALVANGALPNEGVAQSIMVQAQKAPLKALTNHLADLVRPGVITQQTMDLILGLVDA